LEEQRLIVDFEPGDSEWAAGRQSRWRDIITMLRKERGVDRSCFPSTSLLSRFERYWLAGQSKKPMPLVFRLWAHPEPTLERGLAFAASSTEKDWKWSSAFWFSQTSDFQQPIGDLFGDAREALQALFAPSSLTRVKLADDAIWIDRKQRFRSWWLDMAQWLMDPSTNHGLYYPWATELMWKGAPRRFEDDGRRIYRVLHQTANFVEPGDYRGADTPQARFVRAFREELQTRDIPDYVRELWETLSHREGRASAWEGTFGMEDYPDRSGYEAAGGFGSASIDLFHEAAATFEALGYGRAGGVRDTIDLSRHLSPTMKSRLGYEQTDSVPAYRLRIETNSEYSDSERARIHLNIVAPIAGPSANQTEPGPSILWIPRPEQAYVLFDAYTYDLNNRMARREFERRTGVRLYRYVSTEDLAGLDIETANELWGPFSVAEEQPLRVGRNALVDDTDHDFPLWEGDALPPLGDRSVGI
jgi:hypothetical protein